MSKRVTNLTGDDVCLRSLIDCHLLSRFERSDDDDKSDGKDAKRSSRKEENDTRKKSARSVQDEVAVR
jgi:hypothetical protein